MNPAFRILSILALCSASVFSQAQSSCGGLNHLSGVFSGSVATANGDVRAVQFVPNQPMVVDRVRFYFASGQTPGSIAIPRGTIGIRDQDPLSGLPAATPLISATFNNNSGGIIQIGPQWGGAPFSESIFLQANHPYWISFESAPFTNGAQLAVQNAPPGPDVVFSTLNSAGAGWQPITVANSFKMKLSSANCTPPSAPAASALAVGTGCGPAGGSAPSLVGFGIPSIGNSSFRLDLGGAPAGTPVLVYWSLPATSAPLSLGGGCTLYLDPISLLSFVQLGANPIATLSLDAGGTVSLPLPIPPFPAIAGFEVATQAVFLDPNGFPLGGVPMTFSAGLSLRLGW